MHLGFVGHNIYNYKKNSSGKATKATVVALGKLPTVVVLGKLKLFSYIKGVFMIEIFGKVVNKHSKNRYEQKG